MEEADRNIQTDIALIKRDIQALDKSLGKIEEKHSKELEELMQRIDKRLAELVTVDQYEPTKRLVNGMVAIILTSFIGSVVALVLRV